MVQIVTEGYMIAFLDILPLSQNPRELTSYVGGSEYSTVVKEVVNKMITSLHCCFNSKWSAYISSFLHQGRGQDRGPSNNSNEGLMDSNED